MSFGFSVGDFIAAIELANKIRKEFVNSPSQFKAISNEVRSLSIVLQDADVVFSTRELNNQQKSDLEDIDKGCRNVLDELERILDKYGELKSDNRSFGKRIKRVWKRLDWDPGVINELRSRINTNVGLLSAFNERFTSNNVVTLVRHQEDQERRTILDWLTPIDYAPQQSDFMSRRQAGTGQWLLDSAELQTWLDADKQTLFCQGIPGAGKTILTAIVIDDLCTKFCKDPNVGIAYLYCNFKRNHEQKLEDLLLSLLKQLAQGQSVMLGDVKLLYDRHKNQRTRPSLDEILRGLYSITALYSRAFIFVDALDECQVSNGCRRRLISEIFNLQSKTGANLFATSRFIPEIEKEFDGHILLEIRASDEDIQRYLDGHMSRLPKCVSRSPDLQEKIKTEIIKASDGMFLLAQLHLDSLIDKTTPTKIIRALKDLPKGLESLDRAYEKAMERIESQEAGFRDLAKRVLLWITFAKRPLTRLELRHALAVKVGELALDEGNLEDTEEMISVCAGLVTVEEGDITRLIHYTTQEFLKSWLDPRNNIARVNPQSDIMLTCVTYLTFDTFETGFCLTDKDFESRLQENALYDYSARNWGYHAREASTEVVELILDFLQSESKLSASNQVMMASGTYTDYSQRVPKNMTGVHVTAYFGLREAMIALLKNGHDSDSKDSYNRTALSYAAERGYEAVVRELLEAGAQVDSTDNWGRTPLSYAADSGHEAIVKQLLEAGAQVDSTDNWGQTPLSYAAGSGYEATVKQLLEAGAQVDLTDNMGRTLLSYAADSGHEAVVRELLEAGDQVDSTDNLGRTPLSYAADSGHEAVVRELLEAGAQVDSTDNWGQTPLSYVAEKGHEAVVRELLEAGAQVDSTDNWGRTPLSLATENGHERVIKLLTSIT